MDQQFVADTIDELAREATDGWGEYASLKWNLEELLEKYGYVGVEEEVD